MASKPPWSRLTDAATQIAGQVAEGTRELTDRAAASLSSPEVTRATEAVQKAAADTLASVRSTEAYRVTAEQAGRGVATVREKTQALRDTIEGTTAALQQAAEAPDDPHLVLERFEALLEKASPQLDRAAAAVSIGVLGEGGAGVAAMRGHELFYHPGTRTLRVSQVSGRAFRLAVGVAAGAYVMCFYGDEDAVLQPGLRKGVDVDVLVASMGFFSGEHGDGSCGGWMVALGAGLDIAVPILGEVTAFEVKDAVLGQHTLDEVQAAGLDRWIAEAPDRHIRRRLALATMTSPSSAK